MYYVATTGNDTTGNGTITNPWRTIANGVSVLNPGDTLYIRGGDYPVPQYGLQFQHSGVNGSPITLTNYPNEAVTLRITVNDGRDAFYCGYAYGYSAKVDYIRIIGTNVPNRMLSNGVASTKGIVVQGLASGPTGSGISVANCNNWEVAGLDFVDVDSAIWLLKVNNSTGFKSTTGWNIHDNRVHGFYAEVGIQSNGDYNTIANNEVFKVKSSTVTPWGCDHINVNGHHNVVRGNTISPLGGQPSCIGILLEWDLADHNIIEGNRVYNTHAVTIAGGDNNVIRNNIIHNALPVPQDWAGSIIIDSYDNRTSWPCDDAAAAIMPPNNPANPDYPYYYNPRNCHSWGNQIYNNTLANVFIGIRWDGLVPEQTVIRNNAIYNWVKGSVCSFNSATGGCDALPTSLTADHNLGQGDLGFVNPANFDFHLTPGSPLIDAGYSLGVLVPDDFDGELRPRGAGFDIGAHEF